MDALLELASGFTTRTFAAGDRVLADRQPVPALYVLLDGALRIEKAGMPIATISERGACVGEMSLLLGVPATADVVAATASTVAVVDDAPARLQTDARLPLALAQLLAARLQSMTTYLADLKQQYADHEGGLGMVDVVLGTLMRAPAGARRELGSERDPDPEY